MNSLVESRPDNRSKILGLVSLFVASLVAAYLPCASSHGITSLRLPGRTLFYLKHLGTGVIMSTAFTHLLDDAFRDLGNLHWLGYRHWAGLLVMCSIITIFLVEYISSAYLQHLATSDESGTSSPALKRPISDGPRENSPLLENGQMSSAFEDRMASKRQERILGVLILQFGIMTHSFVIGFTMAIASASKFASLLPAIFFHQVFEGFAIGIRLATLTERPDAGLDGDDNDDAHQSLILSASSTATGSPQRSLQTFTPTRTERLLPKVFAVLFAIPIPLLLLISLFVPALQSTPSIIGNINAPERSRVLQGVTSAISAGLLIYVSCVELLAGDFVHDTRMQRSSGRVQLGALVAFSAGALGMSAVG